MKKAGPTPAFFIITSLVPFTHRSFSGGECPLPAGRLVTDLAASPPVPGLLSKPLVP